MEKTQMLIGKGIFTGSGGHTLLGSFTLTAQSDGVLMETSDDFFFDGSPEPDWALYKGVPMDRTDPAVQAAAKATRFGNMPGGITQVHGRQTGLIPLTLSLYDHDTLFLWCFAAPFILGVGPIERA